MSLVYAKKAETIDALEVNIRCKIEISKWNYSKKSFTHLLIASLKHYKTIDATNLHKILISRVNQICKCMCAQKDSTQIYVFACMCVFVYTLFAKQTCLHYVNGLQLTKDISMTTTVALSSRQQFTYCWHAQYINWRYKNKSINTNYKKKKTHTY